MLSNKNIYGLIALLAVSTPTLAAVPKRLFDARSIAQTTDQAQAANLVKRAGNCTIGTGTYTIEAIYRHLPLQQYETEVANAPSGSSYTSKGGEAAYGILTSVEVDAGFFELLSTAVGMPVSSSYAIYTAAGTVSNINCPQGINGVMYNVPVYTEYLGLCTSDDNREIDVYIPDSIQNQFRIQCMYAG